jgi:hypothetical protein
VTLVKGLKGIYGNFRFTNSIRFEAMRAAKPALNEECKYKAFRNRFSLALAKRKNEEIDAKANGFTLEPMIISRNYLRILAEAKNDNYFSALEYLEDYKANVDPLLEWTEFSFEKGLAREIKAMSMPSTAHKGGKNKMLANEQIRLVDVVTGKPLVRSQSNTVFKKMLTDGVKNAERAMKRYNRAHAEKEKLEIQAFMLGYHTKKELTTRIISLLKKNEQHLDTIYKQLKQEYFEKKEQKKAANEYFFDAFFENDADNELPDENFILLKTQPLVYDACEKSARIKSAVWPCWVSCKRELRAAAFRGCYNADLASIQLAIVAEFLEQQELVEILEQQQKLGKKIWSWLIEQLPVDIVSQMPCDRLKNAIKTAIYTICYGGQEKTCREEFIETIKDELLQTSYEAISALFDSFVEIPVIKGLFDARDRYISVLVRNHIKSDDPDHEARSEFACMAQETEQRVMAALYIDAMEEAEKQQPDYFILVNLYDGIIIYIKPSLRPDKKQAIFNRLQAKVLQALSDASVSPITKLDWAYVQQFDVRPLPLVSSLEVSQYV